MKKFCYLIFVSIGIIAPGCSQQRAHNHRPPVTQRNVLAVEGDGVDMNIDTVTPLPELIQRLNGDWAFTETGKAYWIGYTDDMFSIAARENAIPALLQFFKISANTRGKTGALYTLHLIGINRNIAGRFTEDFVNPAARKALLQLLAEPEYAHSVIELLVRDPWSSDIPQLVALLQNETNEQIVWPVINGLTHYSNTDDFPYENPLPDAMRERSGDIHVENEGQLEPCLYFSAQIKEALHAFSKAYPKTIRVDTALYTGNLSPYYATELPDNLQIDQLLSRAMITRNPMENYGSIGARIQYYYENGVLYFCTIATARKRLLDWWAKLPEERKQQFKLTASQN